MVHQGGSSAAALVRWCGGSALCVCGGVCVWGGSTVTRQGHAGAGATKRRPSLHTERLPDAPSCSSPPSAASQPVYCRSRMPRRWSPDMLNGQPAGVLPLSSAHGPHMPPPPPLQRPHHVCLLACWHVGNLPSRPLVTCMQQQQ
mmetsp:Transcript_12511/g.36560  ORF Transcript_12511/g.36560 Transcript_12511/m.36560 type:complete len:144 (+) Transcript_12511:2700-3131(+)